MSDSDPIQVSPKHTPSDFDPIVGELFAGLHLKLLAFLFIIFLFLTSDTFIESFLKKMDGAVAEQCTVSTTTYGTTIQGILLVLFYIIFDILIKKQII